MSKYNYSTKIGENDAAAVGMALPISTKQAIEICTFIRGKKLERAKVIMDNVINEREAIPFKRFTDGIGHRKGSLAGGRYPMKACTEILKMLNSAQANAQFKGLSSSDLIVRHISAQRASTTWHYGRRRAKAKRTTIELVLTEKAGAKPKTEEKATPKVEKKSESKAENKPEVKKEAKPEAAKEKAPEKKVETKAEEKPKAEPKKEAEKKTDNPKEDKTKEAKAEQ